MWDLQKQDKKIFLHSIAHWLQSGFQFQGTTVQIQVGEKCFPLIDQKT